MNDHNHEASWEPVTDAVREFYNFLANDLGAIPSECVVDAPEDGWPSITQSSLAGLEKTDKVIELLRHLPYINISKTHNTQIAFSTIAIDYREFAKYGVAKGTRSQFYPVGSEEFPPHVVVLTGEGEDYYGSLLLLDVDNGRCSTDIIACEAVLLIPSCVGTAIDYQPRSARKKGVPEPGTVSEIWRYSETRPIAGMLASWKQKFRTLEWTVDPFNEEGGMMLRYDRATDVRPSVTFGFAMLFADLSVTRCRKSVRFIVIMAGLMIFGAMNVVRFCESGIGLLMSD